MSVRNESAREVHWLVKRKGTGSTCELVKELINLMCMRLTGLKCLFFKYTYLGKLSMAVESKK